MSMHPQTVNPLPDPLNLNQAGDFVLPFAEAW